MLGPHLGPILFQLPPNLKADVPRLDTFLTGVPRDLKVAFEFRHDSWHTPEAFDCLRSHGAALCIARAAWERAGPFDEQLFMQKVRSRRCICSGRCAT